MIVGVDICIPELGLVFEYDGQQWHHGNEAVEETTILLTGPIMTSNDIARAFVNHVPSRSRFATHSARSGLEGPEPEVDQGDELQPAVVLHHPGGLVVLPVPYHDG